jgi:D-inositol-3-phosphate glycosyltransferase
VIPHGIRTADFFPLPSAEARRRLSLPEDALIFLFLGRIDPRYKANLQPLLTAFSRFGTGKGALLVVAGGEADSDAKEILDRLKFRSVELGIGERVLWLTDVSPDVRRQLLSAADVFVSPTDNLQESFGIAVVEAMSAQLPVIGSDWNGYRDVIVHEETGLLVPTCLPEDISAVSRRAPLMIEFNFHWEVAESTVVDVTALGRAMTRLALDPELRRSMGRSGQERAVALFDWERVLERSREEWEAQLALAREAPEPPPEPLALDHARVFSGHASERLGRGVRIRRTPDALLPSVVLSLPPPFLKRELLQEIVEATEAPIALNRLPGDPSTTARHAAYLLKHGLLDIVG